MNIINSLTFRHIKAHKKRSVLTVMAIIVSVAMVTAVFTSTISFVKYFQNITKAVDGEWHIRLEDSDYKNNIGKYTRDENIDTYGVSAKLYRTTLNINSNTPDYTVEAVNKNYLDMRNVRLSEGRYPQNPGEIIAVKKKLESFGNGWKIGSIITLNVRANGVSENRQYKIVGITDSPVSANDENVFYTCADDETLKAAENINVFIRYNKLDNSIWDKIGLTLKSVGLEKYSYNIELFAYSGIARNNKIIVTFGAFGGVLLLIIAAVSIFMIYDSFAVSYQERAKYLGMLASVGATKKQKRASVYFEGLIFGLIGIPLGIGAGIGGIAVTFRCIEEAILQTIAVDYDKPLRVYVNLFVIVGTVIASALTIFISAYIPACKASKTTAIEAIKQSGTVKIKNAKKLKTSKLTEKLIGYEGVMAVKNFKRNGKRSRNIVFSLALSVVVFLSVNNFSALFGKAIEMSFTNYPDLSATVDYKKASELEKVLNENNNVKGHYGCCAELAYFGRNFLSDEAKKYSANAEIGAFIVFLDNPSFDSYLKQLGEKNTEKFHDTANPLAVIHNSALIHSDSKKIKVKPFDDDIKNIDCNLKLLYDNENSVLPVSVSVGIVTDKDWNNDNFYYQNQNMPLIIYSMDFAETLLKNKFSDEFEYSASITCDEPEALLDELENNTTIKNIGAYVYDSNSQMQSESNILTIAKVFIYGFITLITMISVLNIINTISNSMNERRREFAMIRSVGMTIKSFRRMIYYECFRYGIKALAWALPISVAIHIILYKILAVDFDFGFAAQPLVYLAAVAAVFIIISFSLFYSVGRIKNDNIIETLKEDIN